MYKLKQLPQDFIVKEISSINAEDSGQYAYYILKKTNYSTVDALQILSKKFSIPLKNIGFAGNKDKMAITEQKISIFRGSKNFGNISLNNIELKYLGNGKAPISLGDLEGNEFIMTIRNLDSGEISNILPLKSKKILVTNFFGPQRFSKNNHIVGKALVKRDFRKAVELIMENNGLMESQIGHYLEKNKNNYIAALRLIPLKTRKLFVHSYQSFLFNKIIGEYVKNMPCALARGRVFEHARKSQLFPIDYCDFRHLKDGEDRIKNMKVPLIGFNFELNSLKNKRLKGIIKAVLGHEKINPRDFIISQMPELASEGTDRDLFFQLKGFRILEKAKDELNENKQKLRLGFALPKGCYATVAAEALIRKL